MAKIYASLIKKGLRTLNDIKDEILKAKVLAILNADEEYQAYLRSLENQQEENNNNENIENSSEENNNESSENNEENNNE